MKVPFSWVKECVDIDISAYELGNKLVAAGFEIEEYINLRDNIKNVIVGSVEEIEKHKDSDHLKICKINTGKEVLQIVKLIDENKDKISQYLVNAREIKKWMEERKTTKPPSKRSKDVEEKTLGNALGSIRQKLIKPYLRLKTEEEKEQYRKDHPELKEVQEIVK